MAFFDLAGQTAIVTGGAQGIGAGIVHRLANSGAQVAVADKSFDGAHGVAEQLQSKGLKGFPIAVDVADRTSVEAMVEEVLARNEKIDTLINNAGIAGRAAPVWEQGDEDWQRVLDVNLTGVFFCCRAVMPHMIRCHCCPVKSRIESIGWGHRGIRLGSRMAGVPVKGAFFRIA